MRPPVFTDASLADARTKAAGRFLIIDFTASWCGPCKQMDATTWVEPTVVAWPKDKAVALQLDVDADPVAKDFDIRAMPTVVAIKNDRELDRIVGYRAPHQLLQWLSNLEQGKTELDDFRAKAKGNDLMSRFQLAQALLMRGGIDEATGELEWLWKNSLQVDPSWVGVRHSFLLGAMSEAATASPAARDRIRALRDAAGRGTDDWISLNVALEEEDATLQWFDETPKQRGPLNHYLQALLMERDRWKELGEVLDEPVKLITQRFDQLAEVPAELADEVRQGARAEAEAFEKALRAAGRSAEADAVVAEARRRDAPR